MNRVGLIAVVAILAAGAAAVFHWRAPDDRNANIETDPMQIANPLPDTTAPQSSNAALHVDPAYGSGTNAAEIRNGLPRNPVEPESPEALAAYRQSLAQQYEGLGKALNLTADEVSRIIDILVRFRQDARSANQGGESALQADLQAALGSKYTQWEEYTLLPAMRQTVDDLQTLLEISDIKPMTPSQLTSVATALTSEQVRTRHELSSLAHIPQGDDEVARLQEGLEWKQRYEPDINRRLVLAASRHLDAQQLSAYSKMLEDTYNREVALMRTTLAQRKASARP